MVILRRVIAVRGDARVRVILHPAAGFGRTHLGELHRDDGGAGTAGLVSFGCAGPSGPRGSAVSPGAGSSTSRSPCLRAITTTCFVSSATRR
ncbi:MAG TPA: hypothetical protein VFW64_17590, partial [Pseudonocardiaceae bacterium]|nr:hypothetical protein [Pseudonocardiaceae bacterium]